MSSPQAKQESRKRVLTLEVEGGGRTFDFSSQELKMLPEEEPEIKLHFMRSGKLLKEPKYEHLKAKFRGKDVTIEEDNHLEEVIISSLTLEKFVSINTSLNSGYLYVLDEADPAVPVEYEISEDGGFSSVSWEDPSAEIREKDGKLNTDGFHIAEYEAIVWVGYSPIPWSKDFYDTLKGDVAERKKFMTKVECTGFKEGEENNDSGQSNNVVAANFPYENQRGHKNFQKKINRIADQEELQLEKHEKSSSDKELIRTDMYVSIDDPVGCAKDINVVLAEKIIRFKAFVDAIQTGEYWDDVYKRMRNNKIEGAKPKAEYSSLISLATTCYSMVYDDNKSIDKYDGGKSGRNFFDKHPYLNYKRTRMTRGGTSTTYNSTDNIGAGLDHKKLVGILGVEQRDELRKELQIYREDFAKFLQSRYCKVALEQYLHNLPEHVVIGRGLFTTMLQNLFVHPYHFDRHLLLKRNYIDEDEIRDWIYKLIDDLKEYRATVTGEVQVKSKAPTFQGSDALYALLTKPVDVKEVFSNNLVGFSNGLAGTIKGKLSFHSEQIFATRSVNGKEFVSIKAKHQFVITRLNKNLKVWGEEMFEMSDNQIKVRLEALGGDAQLDWERVKKGKYTGSNEDILRILKRSDGVILVKTKWGNHTLEMPIEQSGAELSAAEVGSNNKNIKLNQVLNSKGFKGAITFLQILNMKGALESLSNEPSLKEGVNAFGAAAELTEAGMVLSRSFAASTSSLNTQFASRLINTAGLVGGIISSGMSFWDSAKAFDRRDTDSALAWAGAGIAFGVATAASLGTIAVLAGPVGWIAAGIGLGFVILANLLTDSDLETYFKNFLLSDHAKIYRRSNESPMSYTKRLLADKEALMGDDDYHKTMMNPADAEATLFDYIVCKEMIFTPDKKDTETVSSSAYNPYTSPISTSDINRYTFDVSITFMQFLNRADCIDYEFYLFPKGLKRKRKIRIDHDGNSKKTKDKDGRDALHIRLTIPQELRDKVKSTSELLLAVRLKIDDSINMYFPYPIGGEERYLGAKIDPQTTLISLQTLDPENKDIKIAPLDELLDHKKW